MANGLTILLGVFTLILSVEGLISEEAQWWMVSLDALVALSTFFFAGIDLKLHWSQSNRVGSTLSLGAALLLFWIIGLAADAVPWLTWSNLIIGTSFLGLAFAIGLREEEQISDPDEVDYRKLA